MGVFEKTIAETVLPQEFISSGEFLKCGYMSY